MMHRLSVFWSASGLLATAFVALSTIQGVSAAHAANFQDWTTVSGGGYHSCGIRGTGELYCWGRDSLGQVGDGGSNETAVLTPTRIGAFADWANVSAGDVHTCGVRRNGKLYCWGSDQAGQIGDEDDPEGAKAPRRIGAFEDWATVDAGGAHTCGVRKNGKLYCWGDDSRGQVGDAKGVSATPVDSPRRIGSFEDWAEVTAGISHSCGVRKNGKLYCWGDDLNGQVGDGDATEAAAPRRAGAFADWANVTAGYIQSCGVRRNGKLYCWGGDSNGQLGDGDDVTAGADAPRRIGTFEDWTAASAGILHTCGVRAAGKLYCWGGDTFGQVGDGETAAPANAPRRITSFEDWANAAAGGGHSCGVRNNGKLYCWGFNQFGQIGAGGLADSPDAPRRI